MQQNTFINVKFLFLNKLREIIFLAVAIADVHYYLLFCFAKNPTKCDMCCKSNTYVSKKKFHPYA